MQSQVKGSHLITSLITGALQKELRSIKIGMCNVFLMHTSASLSINENADPTVRVDIENIFNKIIPDGTQPYAHCMEGDDDMPAHAKCSMFGCSLNIPITNGSLELGTWQGIYLNEHRDYGGSRSIVITLNGTS
ncbi:Secondary thiamine-phosphate synthase enzyme [Entamoeba marina]